MAALFGRRAPVLALAAAAVAAVCALAAATVPATVPATAPAGVAAGGGSGGVVRASVVCPDLRILPGTLGTTISVGAGTPGAGSVRLLPATGTKPGPAAPILAAGQQVGRYAGPLTGPIILEAEGALTGSLVAEQAARGNKTADRGWSEARCEPPRTEQWFVGAATVPGDSPVLVLANPTDAQAVADVTVFTPGGASQTSAGNNLTLAAHTVQQIPVASLAPNARVTAVRVTASSGSVSAAVRDVRTSGLTLLGTDWVPQSSPAATVTLAGLPGTVTGAVPRRIVDVVAPGETDATVSVRVTTPTGTFVPLNLDAVPVQAGTVRALDLTAALGKQPAAVTITSDDPTVPIVATAFVDVASVKNQPIHEVTYLGPAAALRGPALIPFVRTAGDIDSVVVLSAPGPEGAVTFVVHPPTGADRRFRVEVPAGRSVAQSLVAARVPDNSIVTVVPDPASAGTVYAARLLEENGALGPLISAFTLLGAPPSQDIPQVVAQPLH